MYIARTVACAVVLMGTSVQAQPPLEVQWMSEITTTSTLKVGLLEPNTGNVHLVFEPPDAFSGPCYGDEYYEIYGANGLPTILWTDPCLSQGSLDHHVASVMGSTSGRLDVLNVSSVGNPNHSHIFLGGGEIQSYDQGPPNNGYAYAYSAFADGNTVYIGGTDVDCESPGTVYTWLGSGWRSCVPVTINSFEATPDSILAIHYPQVFMMNKATGTLGSTFDLFTGPATNTGQSYLDGDSLYWTIVVSGSMHVGKYVLGQGPVWEQTLPFSIPKGLWLDPYGRLWTAAGNNLIWLNASHGGYASETLGTSIGTLEMRSGELLVSGRFASNVCFIMKAVPTP